MNCAIVVPCYNEEKRLNCEAFLTQLDNSENIFFIFVNDGSKDRTSQVIDSICSQFPSRAFQVSLAKNFGKAEAVRHGMLFALDRKEYDFIGFWDADLAVPLSEIWDFASYFSNENILGVIGSRVRLGGRVVERVNMRHYFGRLFATLVGLTFGDLDFYDTQCGAKLFRSSTLNLVVKQPFTTKWIFDVELLLRIKHNYLGVNAGTLYEVPVRIWRNVPGTKRTFSAYLSASFDFIKLIKIYKFHWK